jgi:tau tubulin kinase
MLRPNTILNDTWEIKKRIGQGSFCELFLARNITDKDVPLVAIKAQNNEIEASIIRVEGDVIKALNGIPSVPKFYCYGQYKGKDYIVMELLGGEDMSRVRNRARAASNANLVVLPAACFLTRAMLKSVKAIHEKGYIHRDIKPANFVRRDRNSSEFCMVDFGLARGYRDKDGNIRPKKENAEFRGTALYASPFIHEGEDQCPRDDLFSLVFVFCDLVCGKLPWSEAARLKDKNGVASLKKQYLTDPRRFLEWIKVQAEEADNTKRFTEGEPNFPSHAQEQCLIIIRHLQALKYEDTPNYALIDEAFRKTVNNHDRHDVSNITYSYGGFDWTCSSAALSTG